jgi:hypothetical protein
MRPRHGTVAVRLAGNLRGAVPSTGSKKVADKSVLWKPCAARACTCKIAARGKRFEGGGIGTRADGFTIAADAAAMLMTTNQIYDFKGGNREGDRGKWEPFKTVRRSKP